MRKLCCLSILLAMLILLSSCAKTTVEPSALMDELKSEFDLTDMRELSTADELYTYYAIDKEGIEAFAACVSNDTDEMDEVLLLCLSNTDAADTAERLLQSHLEARRMIASDYSPERERVLESCRVIRSGNTLALVIADRAKQINAYIQNRMG